MTSSVNEPPKMSADAAGLRYVRHDSPGITRRPRGKAFDYFDSAGKRIRDKTTLERIRCLVIPPAWKNVWICPTPNGHLQATGRDARGRLQYRYHSRYRAVRDATKFDRMIAFGSVLPKIRERVARDLAQEGVPRTRILAAIVRLLDETCIRIGNDEYAKTNHSYGLTTLKNRHAEIKGDKVLFHFRGKSQQDHNITLRDPRLAKVIKKCQDLPGQELFQYESDSGEFVKLDSADVNDYLREITGDDFSAKDFRTWHGTGQMAQELAALGLPESETAAKRNVVEAVRATSQRLGNRPAACRKYYIHPALFECYRDEGFYRAMKVPLVSGPSRGLRPVEKAVLRLVRSFAPSLRKHAKAS